MNFIAKPDTLAKVDRDLKLNEEALRWLVVKKKASLGQDSAVPSAASDP